MVQLLTDEHFVEGILGGLGAIMAASVKQLVPNVNTLVLAVVGFMSVWFIRKIGMNLYKEHKKMTGRGVTGVSVDVHPGLLGASLLLAMIYLLRPPALLNNLRSTGTLIWLGVLLSLGMSIFLQQ